MNVQDAYVGARIRWPEILRNGIIVDIDSDYAGTWVMVRWDGDNFATGPYTAGVPYFHLLWNGLDLMLDLV